MRYREILEACWKGYHREGNKKMFGKTYPNCVKNTDELKQGVAEGQDILKAGSSVMIPHKGKMVPGKVVRYDSGKGGYSPAYVVDIGEYESKIVPAHSIKQGVAEGSDDPWGPQGNFTGDKHVDIGGVTMKIIQVGDTVKYLGQQAKVVEMSKDRKYSRISIGSGFGGSVKVVLTVDLKQLGQGMAEGKVELSTDPNYYGATIDDAGFDSLPVVNIPANRLVGFEPDDKMNQPASKANVEKIVAGLKQGDKLPPLLVRKYKNGYQVLDGHHRFLAYKLLGTKSIPAQVVPDEDIEEKGVAEGSEQNLSIQQLATISDEALDKAYGYGRSNPGNTFGWQANLMSAAYAKKMIDAGVTDIEKISDAIHKGWNVTAQKFVQNPDQFNDTEKLRQAGKLEAKLAQRAKLMKINYGQLDNEEQEKDRVVARALLQAIKGQQGVAETRRGQVPMTLQSGETDNIEPENISGFRALPAYKQGQAAQQKAGKQLIQKSPHTYQSDQDFAYRQGAFDAYQTAMFANFGKSKPLTIEGGEQQPGADYRDPKEVDYDDEYDAMVARVKKLAGLGPMKTVYDPKRRVYRNQPTAVQPPRQPKK